MNIRIGAVEHFYNAIGVAIVKLDDEVKIGDGLLFLGHTTDLTQVVCSIEIEHQKIVQAYPGGLVAIKVDEPVRVGDEVFKLDEEAGDPQNIVLWKQMGRTLEVIFLTYQPVFTEFINSNHLADQSVGILLAAVSVEPGMLSPEQLQLRGPYTSATTWMTRLHAAADKGFLTEPEPGEFRLSRKGSAKVHQLIADSRKSMTQADPLDAQDADRLAVLLQQLVRSCLMTTPPPDTWSIRLAYQLMPGLLPPMPYIEQALSCLNGYRDDAHLAAWQAEGLTAPAIEVLTLIWRGETNSLDGLYDSLAFRGFERHDYATTLIDLVEKGLINDAGSHLQLTPNGKEFRQHIEDKTNQYFFAPWKCLSAVEKTELSCLLSTLREGLQTTTPA